MCLRWKSRSWFVGKIPEWISHIHWLRLHSPASNVRLLDPSVRAPADFSLWNPFCCLWPEYKTRCARQMRQKGDRWLRLKSGRQWKLDLLSFLLLIVLLLWFGSWSGLYPFASLQLFVYVCAFFSPLLFILASMTRQISELCFEFLETVTWTFWCGKCHFELKNC